MKQPSDDNNKIQIKTCPKCRTPIRRTKALKAFIQSSLRDIQNVKIKTSGSANDDKIATNIIRDNVNAVLNEPFANDSFNLRSVFQQIKEETEQNERKAYSYKGSQTLNMLSNKFDLLQKLRKISIEFNGQKMPQSSFSYELIEKFRQRLEIAASFEDILIEIRMLELKNDVIVNGSFQTFDAAGKELLEKAFEIAHKYGRAEDGIKNEFLKTVNESYKHSSIHITFAEKQMVLQAMGFQRGYWYKCPNGHIYAIGDCGGAMETAKCPECQEFIGGGDHRLIEGNAVASEMDGATQSAWA